MDNNMGYFESEQFVRKVCPLTGEEIKVEHADCYDQNCDNVSKDRYKIIYGKKYHCAIELKEIEREHERYEQNKRLSKKMTESKDTANSIDLKKFFDYCNLLDEKMIDSKQKYGPNMQICPFHADDEKCMIYLFSNEKVVEIGICSNPFSYLATRFDKMLDSEFNGYISICAVPDSLSEAINVRQHLIRKMEINSILRNDNPVYIKEKNLKKYIEAAYDCSWLEFKKIRKQHIELTEIVNFENLIYLKPEIDEIVRFKLNYSW